MRSSAMEEEAAQEVSVTRVAVGSGAVGYHESPRKSARVNKEFTLTIPSKAIMWILVVVIV